MTAAWVGGEGSRRGRRGDGEAVMRSYPRILFLAWMLVALIGIALSAPDVPSAPIAAHGAAARNG
jgi:hypothetical protein